MNELVSWTCWLNWLGGWIHQTVIQWSVGIEIFAICFDSDITPTARHEDFRLFACMNPATDVGKKDLPPGIRNRFVNYLFCQASSLLSQAAFLQSITNQKRCLVHVLNILFLRLIVHKWTFPSWNVVKNTFFQELTKVLCMCFQGSQKSLLVSWRTLQTWKLWLWNICKGCLLMLLLWMEL